MPWWYIFIAQFCWVSDKAQLNKQSPSSITHAQNTDHLPKSQGISLRQGQDSWFFPMEWHGRNSTQDSRGISSLLKAISPPGFSLVEGVKVWAQSCVTHMLWYGSLSSPSAVWQTSWGQTSWNTAVITLPGDLSMEGDNDVRGTQMEKYFSEAPLRCLSSIWQAERYPSHKLEEEDQLWTTRCTVEQLCFWGPTHCVVVADVHISSQVSKNLTWFHVWMQNFRFCLKC